MAVRSLIETVACQHLIHRRKYLDDLTELRAAYRESQKLAAKLHSMRRSVTNQDTVREETAEYDTGTGIPFDVPHA
jgi:hypothetical protein